MTREAGAAEVGDRVDGGAARVTQHALWVLRVQHGVARRAALNALIHAGQKAAAPHAFARIGRLVARHEHDKRRQVARFAAESVADPRAETRGAKTRLAGVKLKLRGRVVELIGGHRVDDADLVLDGAEMRKKIAGPESRAAGLAKLVLRRKQRGMALDEGELLALQIVVRTRNAVVFREFRFVVEQFKLAGRAGEVDVDDMLGPRGKTWRARSQRIGGVWNCDAVGESCAVGEHLSKCNRAERERRSAASERTEKGSARLRCECDAWVKWMHGERVR